MASEQSQEMAEVGTKDSPSLNNQVYSEEKLDLDGLDEPETSTAVPQPRLEFSREQTPETADEGNSTYSDSAPESPGSGDEETRKRRHTPSLDTDNAIVKKTATTEVSVDSENPPLAVREIHKKRITGKAIEKLWETLDDESFKSFENLCGISMSNVLERYKHSNQKESKESETQRVLTQHWLSKKLPKSFLARLKVTKLPSSKSLVVRMRGVRENNFDPLDIDQVKLRKAVFESYLSAELKQFESLTAYQSSLENTYNSDLEYLNDFKKTTSKLRAQVSQERLKNEKDLHLISNTDNTPNIKLHSKLSSASTACLPKARFDPDQDEDLKPLFDEIHNEISELDPSKHEILDFCDQLDIIERQLYTHNAM